MFSLNGAVKYKYIPNYQDMRGGYDKLCGVIRSLGENPEDGRYAYRHRAHDNAFQLLAGGEQIFGK